MVMKSYALIIALILLASTGESLELSHPVLDMGEINAQT